jgi:hypothetical protein
MSIGTSKLSGTHGEHKDKLANAVKLLLLWLAASDGDVDAAEIEFAEEHLPEAEESVSAEKLLGEIRAADLFRLEMAIRVLAGESRELRASFLDMAVAMSMADRAIAFTENHLLRFYADALFLGQDMLRARFRSVTGRDLPDPGDPGRADFWDDGGPATKRRLPTSDESMRLAQARTLLALSADADLSELERKHSELKQIFESARVSAMGPAAVKVAAHRLERIEEAYEVVKAELTGGES